MRRVVCREFGSPHLLAVEDLPDPQAGSGHVCVRVRAAAVSFVDGLIVRGQYQLKPQLPFTPGLTVAGEVCSAGDDVPDMRVGDRVLGCSLELGGYASHRVMSADVIVALPDSVRFDVAAAAAESYATMLFAFTTRVSLLADDWVLVLGAGGSIGLAAIDVARHLGARVIAAASSTAKGAAALDAGAQVSVDYESEDLKARVREITGGGADVVVDPVGGRFAEPALRSLRESGRYLVVGFAGGAIPRLPLNLVLLENRALIGVDWGAWFRRNPHANRALLGEVFDQIATGALRPVTPTRFPLDCAAGALQAVAERRVIGKQVLVP
jgi:NADPH2:quinone reductase